MPSSPVFSYSRCPSQPNVLLATCLNCHRNISMIASMTDAERAEEERTHRSECSANQQAYRRDPNLNTSFGPNSHGGNGVVYSGLTNTAQFIGGKTQWRDSGPIYDECADDSDDDEFTPPSRRKASTPKPRTR